MTRRRRLIDVVPYAFAPLAVGWFTAAAGARVRGVLRARGRHLPAVVVETLHFLDRMSPGRSIWAKIHAWLALPFALRRSTYAYVGRIDRHPVQAICIGPRARSDRLMDVILDSVETVNPLPPKFPWCPRALARLRADFLAVQVHAWAAPLFRQRGWLIVPQWVRWRAPLGGLPPEKPSKSLRSNLAKVRGHGFATEVVSR